MNEIERREGGSGGEEEETEEVTPPNTLHTPDNREGLTTDGSDAGNIKSANNTNIICNTVILPIKSFQIHF